MILALGLLAGLPLSCGLATGNPLSLALPAAPVLAATGTVYGSATPAFGMSSNTPKPETTRTPFQPQTYTPTPSITPTASPTATVTLTATPTVTATIVPTHTYTPLPTEAPLPPTATIESEPPVEAMVEGVSGYAQSLPLSCESRSAVDWARFFGVSIGEMEFQDLLPVTDNPNTGFVGDPRGERGSIPPRSYGVHAAPVARLLRAYGVPAESQQGFSWDDLRREVAAGQPVIAWVVGNVWTGYRGTTYMASDGERLVVVPYEHTVIVTGYSPNTVTVVDNALRYTVPLEQFLSSWSVLGNMALFRP